MKGLAMSGEGTKSRRYPIVVLVLSITLAVIALAAGIFSASQDHAQAASWTERGARGDFWGGHIGAAATLAGAFLFFGALLLQSNELKL